MKFNANFMIINEKIISISYRTTKKEIIKFLEFEL